MKKFLIAIPVFMLSQLLNGQLATRIDQVYQDWSLINPSAINATNKSQVSMFYNRLFTGVKGSPTNLMASATFPNPDKRVGLGFNLAQEKIGFSTLFNGYVSYAYTLPISKKSRMHAAASLGLLSQRFNPNAIDVINQDDPYYLSLQQGKPANRFDFRVSASYQLSGFIFGVSSGRLAKPRFDFDYYNYTAQYSLANLTNAFASAKIKLNKDITIQPLFTANFFNFKDPLVQFGTNVYMRDAIWIGVHSAGNKNLSIQIGGNIKNTIKVGYSYSMPFAASSKLLGSGHEFYTAIQLGRTSELVSDMGYESITLIGDENDTTGTANNNGSDGQKKSGENNQGSGTNVISVESIKLRNDTIVIGSFEEIKFLKSGYDTSKILLKSLEQIYPPNGYYVTIGVFKNEANANKHIKNMYVKGTTSYKFFMPENQYYYVYIFRSDTPEEADVIKWQEQPEILDIWTKRIYRK
ncbi:MAG: PorP/SprF family type IX secretion system membrane protein [Bacteroidia bacterium]|nr:PorP/SprF family type IX secretion system membrane protein [Bacteroidia bacterium]